MVSGLVVALTMIGICVVAPTAVTVTTTTVVKKSREKKNALSAEQKLRNALKQSTRDPRKEKKLVKKYFKTKLAAASKVLPSYDNMSKDSYFVNKLSKSEIARQKLISKIGLAELNGNKTKAAKLRAEMQEKYPKPEFSTKYNYLQTATVAGISVDMPFNSIHCDSKSTYAAFQERIVNTVSQDDSLYPSVIELSDGEGKIAAMSAVSHSAYKKFAPAIVAESYVKALVDEQKGNKPEYTLTEFDAENKGAIHEHKFTSSQAVLDCAKSDLKFDMDEFYTTAKEIAKEIVTDVQITIDGKVIGTKTAQTSKVTTKTSKKSNVKTTENVLTSKAGENIVCESPTTKKKFERTLEQEAFKPTEGIQNFETKISNNGNEVSNLKSESFARGTTFTVNLLSEAYRTAVAYKNANMPYELEFSSSYTKVENGKSKKVLKASVFSSPEEIIDFVTSTYNCTKEKFLGMVGELNTELGEAKAPKVEEQSPRMIVCDDEYKNVKATYDKASDFYKNENEDKLQKFTIKSGDKQLIEYTSNKDAVHKNTLFTFLTDVYEKHFSSVSQKERNDVKLDYTFEIVEGDATPRVVEIKNLKDLVKVLTTDTGKTFDQMATKAKNNQMEKTSKEMQ